MGLPVCGSLLSRTAVLCVDSDFRLPLLYHAPIVLSSLKLNGIGICFFWGVSALAPPVGKHEFLCRWQ